MRTDGSCDVSLLDNFFDTLSTNLYNKETIFVIAAVGTTKRYAKRHRVIHNPDYR